MLKDEIFEIIINSIKKSISENKLNELKDIKDVSIVVEKPKNADFGDFAINVSPLARFSKLPPVKIAEVIAENIEAENLTTSVIGGFLNVKFDNLKMNFVLDEILSEKEKFGKNNLGNGEKILLEYVSANPTGPLHIGHGRWACMGSSLANVLKNSGYEVSQEFYINDAGNQINNLVNSLWIRVLQQIGKNANFPTDEILIKNYYSGEYLIETAKKYVELNPETADIKEFDAFNPPVDLAQKLSKFAKQEMLNQQKELMNELNVSFDKFYSELDLHKSGEITNCLEKLKNGGNIFEKDGAKWFATTKYGDDQDRVLIKNDGSYTYLTADIAYHYDKLQRGFERLINIWGADHHGYVARMKAALAALGYNPDALEVLLGQLVNLIVDGEQVRMGKRKKMVTLKELVDEVGVDATRYWMIMRSIDTTLDFDIELAKSKSDDNPVFYVQYAHARSCSILRNAVNERVDRENNEKLAPIFSKEELEKIFQNEDVDFNELWNIDEKASAVIKSLILKLESFNETVYAAAKLRAPYLITKYAQELASDFHKFYSVVRVLSSDASDISKIKPRLALVQTVKIVLKNALTLLGVSAPESM